MSSPQILRQMLRRKTQSPLTALLALAVFTVASSTAKADDNLKTILPALQKHCLHCHGPETAEAGMRIDRLTSDLTDRDNALHWSEIRNALNLGEMPPEGEPRIPTDIITATSRWVTEELRQVARNELSAGGRVILRRLNRHEYTNTVSDLLSMKFPPGENPLDVLPPDGTAEGFDKVSSALLLDPSLMSQYYNVARQIADRAIVDGPPRYPTETMRLEYEEMGDSRAIGYLLTRLGMKTIPGGIELVNGNTRSFGMLRYPGQKGNNVAPVNGFYRFTVRAGGSPGADGRVPRLRLRHDHPDDSMELIMERDITAPFDAPEDYTVIIPRDTLGNELHITLLNAENLMQGQRPGENFMRRNGQLGREGKFAETLRLAGRKTAEGWGGDRSTPNPEKLDVTQYPRLFLDYLEVEGPLYDQWPPKSHTTLLFKTSTSEGEIQPANESPENREYARQIFERFLPRAWRRPVSAEELAPILQVVETELANGATFHEAIRIGLAASLTSPKFLYLVEGDISDDTQASSQSSTLNDYEIASRLSYLLWNSMPDDELFAAAAQGGLQDATARIAQVDRMLQDDKSDRFVESFGRQWLRTDTFLAFAPGQRQYPSYDDRLAESLVREPLEFFRTLLQQDLSTLNFIDSDFLTINQRLARHYGIEGVTGEEFRVVHVPADSPRGGLLAMAGVHQAGSDGARTKPVSRAVYVREVLFNDPPDPPPPNAGEVEPNIKGQKLTVRDRLLQHQQIEACASCHRSLDPYGLALENFNAIGSWRDRQDGERFRNSDRDPPIDASGTLPNGQTFAGFDEFRALLFQQQDRFRRSLAEKLMIYTLGRPIEPTDDDTLNQMVADMRDGNDTFRSLLHSLVRSKAFVSK